MFRVVLEALTPSGTRLLLFEDVHWADEASLDLIRLLARRIDQLRILLLASYRDDEIGPSHPIRVLLGDLAGVSGAHRCPVEPLSPRGVARLAAGRGLDVDELYRVTGGNAFLRDRGVGDRRGRDATAKRRQAFWPARCWMGSKLCGTHSSCGAS